MSCDARTSPSCRAMTRSNARASAGDVSASCSNGWCGSSTSIEATPSPHRRSLGVRRPHSAPPARRRPHRPSPSRGRPAPPPLPPPELSTSSARSSGSSGSGDPPWVERRRRRLARLVFVVLIVAGGAFLVVGVVGARDEHPSRTLSLATPVCIMSSILVLGYALHLRGRLLGDGRG